MSVLLFYYTSVQKTIGNFTKSFRKTLEKEYARWYIISGISENKVDTKANQMELSAKSIDSISKEILMSNTNSNIESAIEEYLKQ